MIKRIQQLTAMLLLILASQLSWGLQDGFGNYIPGENSSFMMAYVPFAGTMVRTDTTFFTGWLDFNGLIIFRNHDNGNVVSGVIPSQIKTKMSLILNDTTYAHFSNQRFLGARVGTGLSITYLSNTLSNNTNGMGQWYTNGSPNPALQPLQSSSSGHSNNISDFYFMPIMLSWDHNKRFFVMAYPGIYLPTGQFHASELASSGVGYWSFDPDVALTWLSHDMSNELDLNIGYMINTSSATTPYHSGNLLHMDGILAKHFNRQLAVGLSLFLEQQLTNDTYTTAIPGTNPTMHELPLNETGRAVPLDGFKAFSWGLGPTIKFNYNTASTTLSLALKYLHPMQARNLFSGDYYDIALSATW